MGDGAFYGPKIDVILKDSDGKEHQTATIQLDFQLPKRFELEYQAPAPELVQKGESTTDHHNGHWPFWLNPRQVMIITVNDRQAVVDYAQKCKRSIQGLGSANVASNGSMTMKSPNRIAVDIDDSPRSIQKKIREAKQKRYSGIAVAAEKDVEAGRLVVDLTNIPKAEEWMPSHPALKRAANLHLSIPSKAKDGSPIRAVHGNFEDQSSVKRPLGLPNLAPEQLK